MGPLDSARGRPFRLALAACALHLASAPSTFAEWTLGAVLGRAPTQDASLILTQPADRTSVTLSPVRYRSASFDPPIYYGYRVGLFPAARAFGIEAEFIHLKVIADTSRMTTATGVIRGQAVADSRPLGSIIERFSISHGLNLLLINAVVRRGSLRAAGRAIPRWILVGRAGAGTSIPHVESTIEGVSLERYERGALSVQGAAGAELRVAGSIYASGEYKLTRTVQDVTIAQGSARTPLVTHHLAVGVALHFGGAARLRP